MDIIVETNSEEVSDAMQALFRDQVPYARSVAINTTLKRIQKAEREDLRDRFTLRRPRWADMNIKIRREDFATKSKPEGAIRLESPGDGDRSDILGKFEEPGTKRPTRGRKGLAVPQERLKRTGSGVIPSKLKPKALGFKRVGTSSSGAQVFRAATGRIWMLRNPDGTGGIFQRVGSRATKKRAGAGRRMASDVSTRKSRDVHLQPLFIFTPSASFDRRLRFEETADQVFQAHGVGDFKEAFERAIVTRRGSTTRRRGLSNLFGRGAGVFR